MKRRIRTTEDNNAAYDKNVMKRFNAAIKNGVSKINAMRDILCMTDDEIIESFIELGREQAFVGIAEAMTDATVEAHKKSS